MINVEHIIRHIDRYQQRHAWLGFPFAVFKKYGDDEAGNKAALITYYAFLSLFPLLLVFLSVVEIITRNNVDLQIRFSNAAFEYFPLVGDQLQSNVHSLNRSGAGLIAGIIIAFIGARGVANAIQTVMNSLWQVKRIDQSGFPKNTLRSLSLMLLGGIGIVLTTVITSYGAGLDRFGMSAKAIVSLVSLALNFGLILLGFRIATAKSVKTSSLMLSALLTAIFWQILQTIGGYFVFNQLKNFDNLYGVFAVVLGLLFWIYLQVQITLYAVEVQVVRTRKLWPRSILQPPLTLQDRRAIAGYAEREQRRPEQKVTVKFKKSK